MFRENLWGDSKQREDKKAYIFLTGSSQNGSVESGLEQ